MKGKGNQFIIKVYGTENSSWQGTIEWLNENKEMPFRSTLELIKLMDGAIEGELEVVTKE